MTDSRFTRGFTLLELLVALFVAAVMFAIGYAGVAEAARNRTAVLEAQRDFGALQRTVRILARDLAEIEARPVRDELGRGQVAAVLAGGAAGNLLVLTRGGRSSGSTHLRGSLQRIEYVIENDALVRRSYPVLDRVQDTRPVRRELLGGVRALRLRFLDARGEWLENWPAGASGESPAVLERRRPRAVEFTLDTARFGAIRRVIEVPG